MLASKSSSKLAYAKMCHHKSSSTLASNLLTNTQTPQQSQQNICDELIHTLPAEQTNYLNQLLQKQERKNKKVHKDKVKTSKRQTFKDKTNIQKDLLQDQKIHKVKNSKVSCQDKSSARIQRRTATQKDAEITRKQSRKYQEQSGIKIPLTQYSPQKNYNSSFVDNISGYLAALAEPHPIKPVNQFFQSRTDPEPTEFSEQQSGRYSENRHTYQLEYDSIANQLQQALQANQILQQTLQQKQEHISQMQVIINNLNSQVAHLKNQLTASNHQKKNYEFIFNDFTNQMHRAQSSSKQKIKKKQKSNHKLYERHSLAHQCHHQRQYDPRISLMNFGSTQFRNTYDFSKLNKFKVVPVGLKKKCKNNQYKLYNIRNSCDLETPISQKFFAQPHQY